MTTPFDPMDPAGNEIPRPAETGEERNLPILSMVAAVIALVVAVVALVIVLDNDDTTETVDTTTTLSETTLPETTLPDPTQPQTTPSTTAPATSEETTTSSTTNESTTSEPSDTVDPAAFQPAVWPWPNAANGPAAQRFDDPVAAAESFAVDFVGFTDPLVGEFQAGDNRSGEVEIRNQEDGPPTIVFVRQLGADDTWWVLGAATDDIVIERPDALEVVDDQLVVEGKARTFEGNVEVIVRADGLSEPVLAENVTGSGDGSFGSFKETFVIGPAAVDAGAVLFVAKSAEDGSVWQASVVRILFED